MVRGVIGTNMKTHFSYRVYILIIFGQSMERLIDTQR
jgi:hypothetical protein